MSVRSKRKPPLDPEDDIWVESTPTVSFSPPSYSGEHSAEGVVVPAVFLDAVDEPDELTPVGWVCNDMTVWWPEPRETIIDAHRAYARLSLESAPETSIYIEDGPVCAEGSQPQWQSAHSSSWIYDLSEGRLPPDKPVEQGEDSFGGCRVVLINPADHEDS